ncbi:MAG: protein translocase subunit SecF [Rhodospirillales bacterium]|nr:protein translocase subunit SecF [Rhodospirillales bacterium]
MRGIQFIPPDTRIPFMRFHKLFLGVSALFLLLSIVVIIVDGLNFGIDFRGGILLEVKTQGPADIAQMRRTLNDLDLGDVGLQEFGAKDNVLIRLSKQDGGEREQQAAIDRIKQTLGPNVDYRRIELVGPQVSAELFKDAMYAMAAALLSIMAYLWFRFEWQFGVAGVVSLLHDVLAIIGIFALLGYEFNLTIVAAVMTIAGYSINDSVVVFDRVRENLRKYKTMPFSDLIDLSINQTLSRTFLTGITTIMMLIVLYFLGGEVLRGFSFAMLFGVIIGTYSSVFVAVPLLLYMNVRRSTPAGETAVAERP